MSDNKSQRQKSILKKWWFWGAVFIGLVFLGGLSENHNQPTASNSNSQKEISKQKEAPVAVEMGKVLHTRYFDIIANKVALKDRVDTGNEFADLPAEQGNGYLIINASFKNTDNESRMLTGGSLWINYNGKNFEFDKTETVMLDGWGLMLDQLNPLTTKTTNLVYKIPKEIKGPVYWQPGRASKSEVIFLGNIK